MNEIMNVMKERRSIRKFKPDMPSKEDLNQIIEAGLYAASGMGKQAAIIVAVTNKELRDKLSEMNRRIGGWEKGFDPFYGAPAVLVVLADKNCPTHVYTKEPLCKYIFSVDVYEDLIGIRSTADWAKGNADVPFMKKVKTNYAASNEADGVIIDGCGGQI